MSMGYAGISVVVIDEEVLAKHCKKELEAFNKLKEEHGEYQINDIVQFSGDGSLPDEDALKVAKAHSAVINKFFAKTGLNISYLYHDVENDGDRYDDIGEAWVVENAYTLTEPAKKLAKYISTAHFVQWV